MRQMGWVLVAGLLGAVPAAATPTAEEIERKVQELGDAAFVVREAASEFLWKAGRAAEPALQKALHSGDAEIIHRARELLDKFKWGIYPDTPPNIIDLIDRYRAADATNRQQVIQELMRLGSSGYATLLKIAAAEDDANLRRLLHRRLAEEAGTLTASLLLEGNLGAVEELLELGLDTDSERAHCNYAAFLLLQGRLDAKIPTFRAKAEQPQGHRAAMTLLYLYRAKGDLAGVRWAAERANNEALLQGILYEQRDWKALAKQATLLGPNGEVLSDIEQLGYRAAYQRLAGATNAFESTVAEIIKTADRVSNDSNTPWYAARVLLINTRPDEALAVLKQYRNPLPAFEILSAQLKYQQAMDVVKAARADDAQTDLFWLELRQARTLYQLGEKDTALQLFNKLTEQLRADRGNVAGFVNLIEAQMRVGMTEQAFDNAAWMLPFFTAGRDPSALLNHLFAKKGNTAAVWWKALEAKFPQQDSATRLKRLRQLMAGSVPVAELRPLLQLAEEAMTDRLPAEDEPWLQAIAEIAQRGGLGAEALSYYEKAAQVNGTASGWRRLGDALLDLRLYKQAAERYRQAWDADTSQPAILYLRGYALQQAGHDLEGRKLMTLARQLPLADEAQRHAMADLLAQRGLHDAALREYQFILNTALLDSWYLDDARRRLAQDATQRKDHLRAADLYELFLLRCLTTNRSFVDNSAYLIVPHMVHRNRARGLLAAGKLDEALREVRTCQALLPGDVQLPILLMPELLKADRAKEAAEIFDAAARTLEKLCQDYPNSAWAFNSRAWLSACCRHDLDTGLAHARKAVALSPKNAGYMDTLAEVLFQKGDTRQAIDLMKQCIALEPDKEYFHKQLARFEKGDNTIPVPDEED